MQTTITIKPIYHRDEERLAIIFPFTKEIDYAVRSLKGVKWTQTHKCWYLPLSKESFTAAHNKLKGFGQINFMELKTYLEKRKHVVTIKAEAFKPAKEIKIKERTIGTFAISPDNMVLLDQTIKTLKLKAYANNTIELYRG